MVGMIVVTTVIYSQSFGHVVSMSRKHHLINLVGNLLNQF